MSKTTVRQMLQRKLQVWGEQRSMAAARRAQDAASAPTPRVAAIQDANRRLRLPPGHPFHDHVPDGYCRPRGAAGAHRSSGSL